MITTASRSVLVPALLFAVLAAAVMAADEEKKAKPRNANEAKKAPALPYEVGEFVERDFPFFSSVLDARDVGEGFPKDNLTPRGIILNLGHNLWACFDPDLLRIACIWEGEKGQPPVTPVALAPRSYQDPGQKTKDGQDELPKPIGKVWLANGIYPGWQVGEKPGFVDPREAGPSKDEVGRGSSAATTGVLRSVVRSPAGAVIEMEINGIRVKQHFEVRYDIKEKSRHVHIGLEIAPHEQPLALTIGITGQETHLWTQWTKPPLSERIQGAPEWRFLPPSKAVRRIGATVSREEDRFALVPDVSDHPSWKQGSTTRGQLSADTTSAFVLDDIPLPIPNPWKRNVRLADIDFLDDQGNAAAVTMDGDVWLISGLKDDLKEVTWRRFASGLHEPMSIVVRRKVGSGKAEGGSGKPDAKNGKLPTSNFPPPTSEILVFDRNGIWKLVDTNGDRECDRYEMFCNLFAQTAETREFPNSMKLGPKGELYIAKGGQQGTTLGKHNGTVIKVAPDGKSFEVIGHGFRQPFIGVHPRTGLVTASDQQGQYVPSTPLHIVRDNQFYGHLASIQEKEKYPGPIAEPWTWIPHPVNPSSVTQVWLCDAKMGPLNESLVHIGYNRPEIFRVMQKVVQPSRLRSSDGQAGSLPGLEASICSIPLAVDPQTGMSVIPFAPLNGKVNPADGSLYLVGFQIWGTTAKKISGLGRVRHTGKPCHLPREVSAMDRGFLLRFDCELDAAAATNPENFLIERWNYKRTFDYGSAHYRLDGSIGQEMMAASSAYLGSDKKSVFIGVPDLKKCDQMHIGWDIKAADGTAMQHNAYTTPRAFAKFDPQAEGFGGIAVDLTPRKVIAKTVTASVEEGKRLYQFIGCMGCHSVDGGITGRLGPSWKGLYGSKRDLKDGATVVADEAYLRESILDPSKKMLKAYLKLEAGMPIYAGILNDSQIESLILYIKTLK